MNVRKEMQRSTYIWRCVQCMYLDVLPMEHGYTGHLSVDYICAHPVRKVAPWTSQRRVDPGTIPDWCPLPDAEDEGGDA